MARSTTSRRTKALHTLKRKNVINPRLKEQILKRHAKLQERIALESKPRSMRPMQVEEAAGKEVVVNGKNWRMFMEKVVVPRE